MQDFLFYLLLGLAISGLTFYLNKGAAKSINQDDEGFTNLKMPKLYAIIGVLGLVGGAIFLGSFLVVEDIDVVTTVISLILCLSILWGLGIICLLWYFNHTLKFDEFSLEVVNVYGKQTKIYWQDITFMKFKPFSGLLILKDENNQKIAIHQHLVGLSAFTSMIDLKTSFNSEELKMPVSKPFIKGF
ncbi:hypothetical protein GU926_01010 [Nibribacter ruber]|uniref:Uncharacterized protein n=1 Tax=Nibribacter ruber TaxID=2698458 RepID=A0A6P1NSU9_9BACT|nr:hypothetical protein [Nibribacter ruber]QHL86100.1 hypothetical protein GU926_01010 [Nibribacter ruber]